MFTQVHRHYLSDLYGEAGEYQIGKTTFYTKWLKDLRIDPLRDGDDRAYVTHEQKQLLDAYYQARQHGKDALAEFLSSLNGQLNLSEPVLNNSERVQFASSELVQNDAEHLNLPAAIALIAKAIEFRQSPPVDPLQIQKDLLWLADRRLPASTSQLKAILGIQPRPGMERYGFRIEKAGQPGREAEWRVVQIG